MWTFFKGIKWEKKEKKVNENEKYIEIYQIDLFSNV